MGKVFITQDYLTIRLSYTSAITNLIASAVIKYRKPDKTEGQWDALHDTVGKKIWRNVEKGEFLNQKGNWRFWSFVTLTDGRVIPGEAFKHYIYTEGSI